MNKQHAEREREQASERVKKNMYIAVIHFPLVDILRHNRTFIVCTVHMNEVHRVLCRMFCLLRN